MIALTLLGMLGCTCSSDRAKRPAAPSVDREAVVQKTCYAGNDGTLLELEVSARPLAKGVLTRGGEEIPLVGSRTGRALDFGAIKAELLGQQLALVDGGQRRMLNNVGCPAPEG